jgi:hypothetical protein
MALTTLAEYRNLTGDAATDDALVEILLPVAQDLLELELGRAGLLVLGVHVETLEVWNGYVYPNARPIDPATPGYASPGKFRPTGASLVAWQAQLYGYGASSCLEVRNAQLAKVTYMGGYDDTTAPYPLKLAIARTAQALVPGAPGLLAQAPAGTKSISVGDVSITLARALGTSPIPFDVLPLIQAYRAIDVSRT